MRRRAGTLSLSLSLTLTLLLSLSLSYFLTPNLSLYTLTHSLSLSFTHTLPDQAMYYPSAGGGMNYAPSGGNYYPAQAPMGQQVKSQSLNPQPETRNLKREI